MSSLSTSIGLLSSVKVRSLVAKCCKTVGLVGLVGLDGLVGEVLGGQALQDRDDLVGCQGRTSALLRRKTSGVRRQKK